MLHNSHLDRISTARPADAWPRFNEKEDRLTSKDVCGRSNLDCIFAEMKREGSEARSSRWRGDFDRTVGASRPIVLFGAGQFGQLVLARLRRAGVEPIAFSDNKATLWGGEIEGIKVLDPVDAVARFGTVAAFVVTVFNGSGARKQLREMNCQYVALALQLFWKFENEFMPDLGIDTPDLILQQEEEIRECFEVLADEHSRRELCNQILWRYWCKPEYLPLDQDPRNLYFPDLIAPNDEEVIADCGAFDGDTIRSILSRNTPFRHIYAFEPDQANRDSLERFISQQSPEVRDRISVRPYAISDTDGFVSFVQRADVSSMVILSGDGIKLESRRLDSLPWSSAPTYIKMDIEGSEPQALTGGSELMRTRMPTLAISLYHRSEHLWQIPIQIHRIQPEYSLFLRRYAEDCWEQVCYAVPHERLAK
jgi:FkbM family methyltransferase